MFIEVAEAKSTTTTKNDRLYSDKIEKKKDNALPGERVRAVGMCYYGTGQDLVKARKYNLERNSANVKDVMCIEVKLRGQVRATLNVSISLLLTPLMDSSTVWDTTWLLRFSALFSL